MLFANVLDEGNEPRRMTSPEMANTLILIFGPTDWANSTATALKLDLSNVADAAHDAQPLIEERGIVDTHASGQASL